MIYYQVADLYFSFSDELKVLSEKLNYTPFRVDEKGTDCNYLFNLGIDTHLQSHVKECHFTFTNEVGCYAVTCTDNVYEWVLKAQQNDIFYVMRLDIATKVALINFEIHDALTLFAADDFVRFAFIYTAAFHHTVLLHASCISYQDKGIAFMGRSGIGKSTHSANWQKYIEGSDLLNDDQPAVRILQNNPVIYGTPWSGKTTCYKQKKVPLTTILCMEQKPYNKLIPINKIVLFTHLLSACSLIKSEKRSLKEILRTLAEISERVHGAVLQNVPNKEAVEMAYTFFKN